ncbi:MAG TPA: filamentous hemagglutinin N-terminal domain-containing protein, partial [Chlamydiales bacterium]|nr:filamentous hemagglutinin N-terminal domain-containing protein [Chlamydiales bacterium]
MGARAFVSRLSWGLCLLSYGVVYAAPEGFHLVSGEAAPQPSAVQGEMVVGSHGRAIIEWGKFSIGAGERVHFDQHGINPAVLNRVIGSDPSHILGQLSSNGEVFLINRQGVIFGAHARVETAGFIAASLDVLNEDFLHAHNLLFSGTGRGSIVNMGTIECPRGNIALIGSMVENTGALRAPEGFVALGVGSEVLLQPEGMPHLLIKTALEPEGEEALINHEGLIEALRVELKSGTSVFTKAIQNSGSIDALVFEERGGEVFLVAEGGQCILEGARITAADGGMVQVLGTEVQLLGDTMIDASGKEGGGEVLIGGDNRGENPDVFNADWTSVGPDVVVKADALERGDGGKVIYWGNRGTRYWGSTSVKGAVGGFVEVSGAWFEYEGHIAGAKDVLFDPADITISTGTQTGGMFSGGVWTSTSTPATINRTNIQNLLNTPTNVLIDTSTTSPALTGQGDILISSNITWGTTATLTLIADANIRVVATVQSTNGAASTGVPVINFQAKGDSTSSPFSGILLDTGTVIRSATQSIFLQGRGSTIAGQNDMPGIVLQGSATIQTDTGTITLIGQGGGVNTVSTTRNYGVYNQGQTITATGAGNIIIHATGGAGTGGANHGFLMDGGTLSTGAGGTIEIVGIAGVGGNTNKGISFSTASATITATQITMEGIGGNTTANDYGIEITGGLTFGDGTITNQITMTGTNIGTGSNQYGVQINGATLQVNNGGTIGITGIGGGFYLNSNGGSNYGVNVTGTNVVTLGSVGGTGLNTINMTGIGGSGTAGTHIGVNIDTSFTMNMNGTNPNNSFNFINCAGGNGSSGSNYGVQLQTGFTHQGNLTFQNCTGGSGGQNNYGVFFTATSSTIAASNILATDCFGGAGTGNDYGIYVINATTLGTTTTASISMNGGSLGTGSNEIGIFVTGDGRLTVGDNGTINLVGTGGGFYNGAGTNNHGVSLFSMRFFLGVPGGSKPATINITGIGGSGSQGSHCGVDVAPFLSMNISGTNQNISFNFLNCLGGHGTGGGNSGVQMSGLIVTFPGFLTFQNCVGGSGGQNNHGVFFTTSMEFISASNIIATDCLGGPGTGNDIGFFVSVGRLGDTTAERISISAGSLGTGSNEVGIQLNPANAIVVGNGGTINLVGTGGGFYNGGGSSNHGVFFNTGSTIAAGVGGSAGLNTISITGLGGSGSGGNHMGVYYTGAGITLNGTNPANALNFINCVGGSGSGGNNSGMQFAANFSVGNSWMLENITGGSGGKSNHGVFVNGVTVAGTNITAVDC